MSESKIPPPSEADLKTDLRTLYWLCVTPHCGASPETTYALIRRCHAAEASLATANAERDVALKAVKRVVDCYDFHGDCLRTADLQMCRDALASSVAKEKQL